MKKMLSLAAMLAVLSYASPASAELKIGGDVAVRERGEFNNTQTAAQRVAGTKTTANDDLKTQYRIRLKAAADLGDGYFAKLLIQNEEVAGSWQTIGANNVEKNPLEVSNFYFGRALQDCHYMVGRLPLNSFNNPIFDLALVPIPAGTIYPVDIPVFQYNFDRIFGLNYGTKVGNGDLNATLVILDNHSTTTNTSAFADGLLNDGYALHLTYKTTIGDVSIDPQAVILLTDGNGATYSGVSPNTFGANASIPVGKSKIGLSGFYTVAQDSKAISSSTGIAANVDYTGYLARVKGESGPVMAWVDYNRTKDNSTGASVTRATYNNVFVWAQYNVKLHESAAGTFNLTPTVRYRASGADVVGAPATARNNQLRTELYATMTF
jgi:hypothetical protein